MLDVGKESLLLPIISAAFSKTLADIHIYFHKIRRQAQANSFVGAIPVFLSGAKAEIPLDMGENRR